MIRTRLAVALAGISLAIAASASANQFATLQEATRNTVLGNPEVQSAFHEFQAAEQEARIAKGGYYPRVDLEAGIGEERIDDPRFSDTDFGRDRVSVSLSQMLFDGFSTRNEVRRLNHATRTRYYEVLDASEQAAADVARAYFDVLRHRNLVRMSEDNYATHRMIYDQIQRRVQAGVSRRVDLEQAAGRLALSESNLLTDVTNLHDVSMRYQRIVGELPAEALEDPKIVDSKRLPDGIKETLQGAYQSNPLMNAAIANMWSADAAKTVAKAAFSPRFHIQARQDVWHDKDDIDGRYEEGVIELVMRYNLYNGGSDLAARRRQESFALQALDIRNKTCRDIRQTVSIAWNNTRRLEEQRGYLDRHQLAIEKAREAYRRQFDIGQRTLLDMLDTENEYYEARRAYLNADRDHAISYAQTLAGMGSLLSALGMGTDLHPMEMPPAYDDATPDMYAICPQEGSAVPTIDKEKVFRDAMDKQGYYGTQRPLVPDAAPTGAPGEAQPAAPQPEQPPPKW